MSTVLDELKSIGILGKGSLLPICSGVSEVVKTEVVEDSRKAETLRVLDGLLERVEGLRFEIQELRALWASGTKEVASEISGEVEVPVAATEGAPSVRFYEEARARALRKIRGEDQVQGVQADPEEAVPFVGQVRAIPEHKGLDEEVSLGTIGTVKPSFSGQEG